MTGDNGLLTCVVNDITGDDLFVCAVRDENGGSLAVCAGAGGLTI